LQQRAKSGGGQFIENEMKRKLTEKSLPNDKKQQN